MMNTSNTATDHQVWVEKFASLFDNLPSHQRTAYQAWLADYAASHRPSNKEANVKITEMQLAA